jgi:DNA polymerase
VTPDERRTALDAIADEIRDCTRCRLHEGRTRSVPGEGSAETEVVLVGEGPGSNEDRQGRPFVGAAGSFLTELLGSVGWRRDDVFITNIVKCRPPGNRDPEPDEVAACIPYLRRQLDAIDPALVVTLGRHSLGSFLPGARIGQVHGTTRPGSTELGPEAGLVFAMYHPAAALHQGSLRQTLLDDALAIPGALLQARERREHLAAAEGDAVSAVDAPAAPAVPPAVPPDGQAPTMAGAGPRPPIAEPEPGADQLTLFR